MRSCKSAAWLVAILLLGCSGLCAQTPTAEVTGTVLDSSGATVPNAAVRVTNQETNVVSEKDTNSDGAFTILNLLPGNYVMTIEKQGFKTVTLPVFKLDVDQNLTEKITMQVGSTTENVTVSATSVGQLIQRSSTELGTLMDETAMKELPLNGRSFTQLLILQPGSNPVATAQGGNGVGSADGGNIAIPGTTIYRPGVNGASSRSNAWYLDGVINTESTAGTIATPVIADTIQEFKMQSHNDDPGYGNVMGAVVNVATKSGTNNFHGDAWEFARNNIFDARNPFTDFCSPATCPTDAAYFANPTGTKPGDVPANCNSLSCVPSSPVGYSQNEYGGTFGGPIFKNKTFFFIAYEGWRYSKPANSFQTVPNANELNGDFSGLQSQCPVTGSPQSCGITPATPANAPLAELQGTLQTPTGSPVPTGIIPNQLFNPYAEYPSSPGCNVGLSAAECTPALVPFQCYQGVGGATPLPLLASAPSATNPQNGYGVQTLNGTGAASAFPCNILPPGLIDQNMASVIKGYLGSVPSTCVYTPNYALEAHNCFDTREQHNNSNNMDARIDQHFGSRDTLFGRASMFWDDSPGVNAGTTSLTDSPYHTWNIGGAWDHIFTPNLILEVRGGVNSRPVQINPTNSLGTAPIDSTFGKNLSSAQQAFLNQTAGFYVASLSGYSSTIGNVGTELRANPESDIDGVLTWIHGKHNIKIGASYLYEDRLESNKYLQFNFSNTQTCPLTTTGGAVTAASTFNCTLPSGTAYTGAGNALASALLDLPSSFGANLPQFEEIHATMTAAGGFIQDSWHIRPNLTINVGLRYDFDFPVTFLAGNGAGETINAYDYQTGQYIIGSAETSAYSTGCGNPVVPPCVPNGLSSSNPVFEICTGASVPSPATAASCTAAGGVFYDTTKNISFTGGPQAGLQSIKDNIQPRIGIAWQFRPNTVLRFGLGMFYDTLGYREQYAENELQGSTWPYTRGGLGGGNPNINVTWVGNTATSSSNQPICYTATQCGPFLGLPSGTTTGLIGVDPIQVVPSPWSPSGYSNEPNYSDPRSEQWNLQIERQLSASTMVSIAYVGSRTQRLDWCCKVNIPTVGANCQNYAAASFTCSTTPLTPLQRLSSEPMPWAGVSGQNYSESTGYSNYNSFQAQFQRRFSKGLETLVAYTWSKCFADTNGDFGVENGNEVDPAEYYYSHSLDYGPCANDIPVVFQWSTVYDLPFGRGERWMNHGPLAWVLGNWETSFAYLARSGQDFNVGWNGGSNICAAGVTVGCLPYTISGYENNPGDPANLSSKGTVGGTTYTNYSRPDVLPGCNPIQGQQTYTQWYTPQCFVSPASPLVGPGYGFGAEGIGSLRDMFFTNADFSLMKNIKITESKSLQLRFEAFNVFNHMVLGNPNTTINPVGGCSVTVPKGSTCALIGGATTITYGQAGIINSIASTPRELQLAAKFYF